MDKTITVPGTGRIVVEPDVASVRLGVNIVRESAGAAREAAAETMNAILVAVLGQGVERRDVRTALVSLSPMMDYQSQSGPRITGYQVMNTLSVTVRALDTVGAVIDAALGAGASTLDSLEFRLDDSAQAEAQARAAAVADARFRAATIAAVAQVELGGVVSVSEGAPPSGPIPFGGARMMTMKAEAADTVVESGTQEISVSVVVTFAIG